MEEYRKTIRDIDVSKKYVLLRAGLDVPLDATKELLDPDRVKDDTRIRDILPTLKYLIEQNAKIILAAGWCGRPEGEESDYSMAPVAKKIEQILREEKLLKHNVLIAPNCFEDKKPRSVYKNRDEVKKIVKDLKDGQIVVLENVRYDVEANINDKDFAAFFASLADIYVNDNETQNHRKEATIVTTPLLIAQKGGEVVYGFKYVDVLDKIGGLKKKLENQARGSFVFGLCGKKIESNPGITSKITVGVNLMDKMHDGDVLIAGGGVVYTFLLAQYYAGIIDANLEKIKYITAGYDQKILSQTKEMKDKKIEAEIIDEFIEKLQKQKSTDLKTLLNLTDKEIKRLIGSSYIRWGQEGEQIVFAYNIIAKAKIKGIKIITACDHIIANTAPNKGGMLPKDAKIKVYENPVGIPEGWLGVGEGPKTLKKIADIIKNASIYLQSGPFSIEEPNVEKISQTDAIIFEAVKWCKEKGGLTIGAGGDTVARIHSMKKENSFSIITSAGGATLELIETGTSKGKEAVEKAQDNKKVFYKQ